MKRLIKILMVILITSVIALPCLAQTAKQQKQDEKAEKLKQLIESRNFVFQATYMSPMGGGQIYLTSPYDVTITRDSVTSFLPYFGVAYMSTGYSSSDNGIKFTSTKFDYQVQNLKKGGYRVIIKPKDVTNLTQMFLEAYPGGYASLSVISVNRQQISFQGNVKERPKTKS